jgi:hypothetical protein
MAEQLEFGFMDENRPTLEAMMRLFPKYPRDEPCSECNPELWRMFCEYRGRIQQPSYVWMEEDVYDWLAVVQLMERGKTK